MNCAEREGNPMPKKKTAFKAVVESIKASTKVGRLRAALLERIETHRIDGTIPTSNRFLYYELEGKDDGQGVLVSKVLKVRTDGKKGRRSDQGLIEALTELREDGLIGWDEIVDETRSVDCNVRYGSVREAVESYKQYVQIDPWQLSDTRPFVLCESRSLAGVLRATCNKYGVDITSVNGQCQGFLRTKLAAAMNESKLPLHILYAGDADKGGADIEAHTQKVLRECVNLPFTWERIMITQEQVEQYDLPSIIKTDKRTKVTYEAWECESLSQKIIVDLIVNRLDDMLQPRSLDTWQQIADYERSTFSTGVTEQEPEDTLEVIPEQSKMCLNAVCEHCKEKIDMPMGTSGGWLHTDKYVSDDLHNDAWLKEKRICADGKHNAEPREEAL
jgi:hypothetical protein